MSAIAAAAITAGAGIIGGIFDRNQRKKDAYAISPAGIRKNSEAAGFNPLVFAGAQQSLPYGPVFGSSIANAASQGLATYQGAKQLELSEQRLQMDNQRLTQQLQKATLNPVVPSKTYPLSAFKKASPDGSPLITPSRISPIITTPLKDRVEGWNPNDSTQLQNVLTGNSDSAIWLNGNRIVTDQTNSDSSVYTERYGEKGEDLSGLNNIFQDAKLNMAIRYPDWARGFHNFGQTMKGISHLGLGSSMPTHGKNSYSITPRY